MYTSRIRELMAQLNLNDRSALEAHTSEMPNISEYTDFDFYQFVINYDPNNTSDNGKGY
jgi:hypothetical protein